MKLEQWQQIEDLFHAALEHTAEERATFLAAACGADASLHAEVAALLAAHEDATASTLDLPAQAVQHAALHLAAEKPANLRRGATLSHYQILSLLGRGGMGEVYLAEDSVLSRQVALKLLPPAFTNDAERLRRFAREARAASKLNHPNIVTIHELGQHEQTAFIVTEYVAGQTLRQRMNQPLLLLGQALDIAMQIASALDAAHTAGIIHRDVKPENVMLRPDGLVKVLDFGLAKLTEGSGRAREREKGRAGEGETGSCSLPAFPDSSLPPPARSPARPLSTAPGVVMGTINYMSPEQARGLNVDARTDLFSLGVVLYEMVTGQAPFMGATPSDVMAAILTQEPLPLAQVVPTAPAELHPIITRLLSKDVTARYQTCQKLLADLRNLQQQVNAAPPEVVTTPAAPPSPVRSTRSLATSVAAFAQPLQRHWRATLFSVSTLLLAATAFFSFAPHKPPLTEKDAVLLSDFTNTTGDAVFDDTLKRALAVQLEQSPFLSLYPDSQARETLRYMGRSSEEHLTTAVAREIAVRRGIKATVTGSIAALGQHYVLALEALHSQTGDVIARVQIEAESKEQVLKTLGQAAVQLRQKLGESLTSIQRFSAPLEQATTSSLEAFQQFALAYEVHHRENLVKARPLYQRAVELDPNFALAYARLAAIDSSLGHAESARTMAEKAFMLRDRVSERERFIILYRYYDSVTQELEKAVEVLEQWQQVYPRDHLPPSNLAARYTRLGQFDAALAAAQEALRRNAEAVGAYANLGQAFLRRSRYDEAQANFERALQANPDLTNVHLGLHILALVKRDPALQQREEAWAAGRPADLEIIDAQAAATQFAGRFQSARSLWQRGVEMAKQRDHTINSQWWMNLAWLESNAGNCAAARGAVTQALALDRPAAALSSARILASCGELAFAQSLVHEVESQNSSDTLMQKVWLPVTKAALALQRRETTQVLDLLQATKRYEGAAQFWPAYLRGQAYLRLQNAAAARAEFQAILAHRGYDPHSLLYAAAYLGLARAAALAGDLNQSRQAYQDLLALWTEADTDLPLLRTVRKEYEQVR